MLKAFSKNISIIIAKKLSFVDDFRCWPERLSLLISFRQMVFFKILQRRIVFKLWINTMYSLCVCIFFFIRFLSINKLYITYYVYELVVGTYRYFLIYKFFFLLWYADLDCELDILTHSLLVISTKYSKSSE